jgi:iron-desferrioxamine transport system substrate-binding protein
MRLLGLFVAGLLSLAACAAPAADPGGGGGTWSFTDDLDHTVTLPGRPTRIAGLTDVVASLWNYGIAPVATFGYTGLSEERRFATRAGRGTTGSR